MSIFKTLIKTTLLYFDLDEHLAETLMNFAQPEYARIYSGVIITLLTHALTHAASKAYKTAKNALNRKNKDDSLLK